MLNIDIPTLRLVSVVIEIMAITALFSFWRTKALRTGIGYCVLGIFSYACNTAHLFFPPIPYIGSLLPSFFTICSCLLILHGTRQILKKTSLIWVELSIFLSSLILNFYFTKIVSDGLLNAIQSTAFFNGFTYLLIASSLIDIRRKTAKKPFITSSIIFFLYSIFNFLITIYLGLPNTFEFSLLQIYLNSSSFFILAMAWTLVLIAYETLETESAQSLIASSKLVAEAEQRWLLALDFSNATAWDWKVSDQYISFSPLWKKMLGYAEEDQISFTLEDLASITHPDSLETINQSMESVLSGDNKTFRNEFRAKKNDGTWMWILSQGTIISDNEEEGARRIIGTNIDITEHKLTELALNKAKNDAELANKAKSTFLSHISHEIRTPMNAILGFSQLLQEDVDTTTKQQESLAIINKSGEHLLSLIENILDWSRIESGNTNVHYSDINLDELLSSLYDSFNRKIVDNEVEFFLEKSPMLPNWIRSDPMRIRQICLNLLSNAFKFTEKGNVTLKVKADDLTAEQCTLIIQVFDTGIGIAEEESNIIFEAFGQTTEGMQATSPNSGLGLYISKNMACLLGGELTFASEPSAGSCFTLTLPVEVIPKPKEMPEKNVNLAKVESLETRGLHLLIVDDVESNRLLLKQMLDGIGFIIDEADNATSGLEKIEQLEPSLVLMDIKMPGLSGDKAISEIRQRPACSNIPIIAVTANVLDGEKERLLEIGANDFVSKPFSKEEVLDTIARVLNINYIYSDAYTDSFSLAPFQDKIVQREAKDINILIVDDNKANQQLLTIQIQSLGYQVEAAADGEKGFQLWQNNDFDIVFTDCSMPVMNGFEMTKKIRANESTKRPPITIIAITGSVEEYKSQCIEAGMNDILGKPFLLNDLKLALHKYINL